MTFVGLIIGQKEMKYIEKNTNEFLKEKKVQLIEINEENIENLKHIKFETILLDDVSKLSNKKVDLQEIISNCSNIIINSDNIENLNYIPKSATVITYGFNSKASITVSSIDDENILICIQRNIKTIYGRVVEQQEKNIKLHATNKRVNSVKQLGILVLQLFYEQNLQ